MNHILYQDGDRDAPEAIKDRDGFVVLGMCRVCRRAESSLSEPCDASLPSRQAMTDSPINIPAMIERLKADPGGRFHSLHGFAILPALEQAQAEIMRLNELLSFADSTIRGLNDRDRYGRKQVMLARTERDDLRAENVRLRDALRAVAPLLIPGITWTDETGQLVKRMVREALAATPPAAEQAGPIHAPRCPACFRTCYTRNGRFWCDHCYDTTDQQPATQQDEIVRLHKLEHVVFHALDDAEELPGGGVIIDWESYRKIDELIPEEHPQQGEQQEERP